MGVSKIGIKALGVLILSLIISLNGGSVAAASGSFDGPSAYDTYNHTGTDDATNKKKGTEDQSQKVKTDATQSSGAGSTFVTFLKLLAAMAVILGLIYLLYRLVSKRNRAFQDYGAIKNLGGVPVGPNRSVQLIRIGQEILVVGVGESVQLLKEIKDAQAVSDILEEKSEPDNFQKGVTKMVSWVKEQTGRTIDTGRQKSPLTVRFDQQLKDLIRERSNEVEKRLRKDPKHE
ncbi:flagellar biosynthetic protein FliO [Camelliibacillus cellulosilyticus]